MADSEAALKSRPCVAFVIRSALVCLETGNPWVTTKGTDTKAASKSRRWVAFSSGRPWFTWRQGQPVDGDERNWHQGFSLQNSKATGFGSEPKPNPSSSALLENPLDPNPRLQRFPREPVKSEPAVPALFSRTRWIRTRGSTVKGGNPLGPLEPFALLPVSG